MIPFTGIPSDRQYGITRWRGTHQYSTDRNITRFGGTARFLQRSSLCSLLFHALLLYHTTSRTTIATKPRRLKTGLLLHITPFETEAVYPTTSAV